MMLLAFVLLGGGLLVDEALPYEGYWMTLAGVLLFIPSFAFVVFRRDRHDPLGKRP